MRQYSKVQTPPRVENMFQNLPEKSHHPDTDARRPHQSHARAAKPGGPLEAGRRHEGGMERPHQGHLGNKLMNNPKEHGMVDDAVHKWAAEPPIKHRTVLGLNASQAHVNKTVE